MFFKFVTCSCNFPIAFLSFLGLEALKSDGARASAPEDFQLTWRNIRKSKGKTVNKARALQSHNQHHRLCLKEGWGLRQKLPVYSLYIPCIFPVYWFLYWSLYIPCIFPIAPSLPGAPRGPGRPLGPPEGPAGPGGTGGPPGVWNWDSLLFLLLSDVLRPQEGAIGNALSVLPAHEFHAKGFSSAKWKRNANARNYSMVFRVVPR